MRIAFEIPIGKEVNNEGEKGYIEIGICISFGVPYGYGASSSSFRKLDLQSNTVITLLLTIMQMQKSESESESERKEFAWRVWCGDERSQTCLITNPKTPKKGTFNMKELFIIPKKESVFVWGARKIKLYCREYGWQGSWPDSEVKWSEAKQQSRNRGWKTTKRRRMEYGLVFVLWEEDEGFLREIN